MDQDRTYMANIRNSQRSTSMGAIADALLSGKSGLNEYEIKKWMPLIGGTGLGDLFMGQAPELVNDISYYGPQAAFKGGNRASGGLGTLQPKRETFDAAMLGMDATGLAALTAKMGGNLSKAALNKMAIEAGNLSRRKFLKGSAAVAGSAALGGLLKLGKEAGEQVAKHSTDNIANKVAKEAPKKYKFNSLKEYNDYLNDLSYDAENFMAKGRNLEYKRFLAEEEEKLYNKIKFSKETDRLGTVDLFDNPEEVLNAFSPQAKAEMKIFKNFSRREQAYLAMENTPEAARFRNSMILDDGYTGKFTTPNGYDEYLTANELYSKKAKEIFNSTTHNFSDLDTHLIDHIESMTPRQKTNYLKHMDDVN